MAYERFEPYQALDNLKFQDWMAREGVMNRVDIPEDMLIRKARAPRYRGKINEQTLDMLEEHQGYVVTPQAISRKLSATHDYQDIYTAGHCVSRARKVLVHPETIYTIGDGNHVGWAIGVDNLRVFRDQLPLLYKLWEKRRHYVTQEELSRQLFGFVDENTLLSIENHMRHMRDKFATTNVGIDQRTAYGDWTPAYKLHQIRHNENKFPAIEPFLPPHLELAFQDWLAQEDVGALKRQKRQIRLRTGEALPFSERYVLSVLTEHSSYIIPTTYLSTALYGDSDRKEATEGAINRAKARLKDETVIFHAKNLGYARDIEQLKAPRNALIVLRQMWDQPSEPIAREVFLRAIDEQDIPLSPNTLAVAVLEVRQALDGSEYEVFKRESKQKGTLAYGLRKQINT